MGVRLSTLVTVGVFLAVAAFRRDPKPLVACTAWLGGFEAAFQLTALVVGHPFSLGRGASEVMLAISVLVLAWATALAARPNWPLLAAALVVGAIWVATGFHTNFHGAKGFDSLAEALNEGAKTLWALAYLMPVLQRGEPRARDRGEQ